MAPSRGGGVREGAVRWRPDDESQGGEDKVNAPPAADGG